MLRYLLDIIYPRPCIGCSRILGIHEAFLCLHCSFHLPLCSRFGSNQSLLRHSLLGRCKTNRIHAWLSYSHRGVSQKLIHEFKYHGNQKLGEWLGKQIGYSLEQLKGDKTVFHGIVPVPLHPKKLKSRGFNQSWVLAKGISDVIGVPIYENALVRTKHDKSQTSKNRFERFKNCSGRFKLCKEAPDLRSILVVDDVITTGSTLESCILELETKYTQISVASIAYVE